MIDTNQYRNLATAGSNGLVTGGGIYVLGTSATLSASPNPGFIFTGWSGDATGTDNPLSVLMDSDKSITANFGPDTGSSGSDGLNMFGRFTYTDNGTSITITDYPESAYGGADIPATIVGKPVTSIGDYAFHGCTNLTSVTIPTGVVSIGDYSFAYCTGLTSVTIPASVVSIGSNAFVGCTGLASITIPFGVTSVGNNAFYACTGLTSVTISSSVASIGDLAFYGCNGLTSVTIPASMTSIGGAVFASCAGRTSIEVDVGNSVYSSVGGVLFNKQQTSLIQCPAGLSGNYSVPSGVVGIFVQAFRGCTALTSITIPPSVTWIGGSAFYGCTGLTNVTIPIGVTSIGSDAFRGCSKLTSATFIGNSPLMGSTVFDSTTSEFKAYYFNGKMGFATPTWNGYHAVNMGAESPTKPWLITNGFAYDTNLQSDPNNDSVNLLMAYALNLDPQQNMIAHIPQSVLVGNQIKFTFYAGNSNVTYTVQSSTDLTTWSTAGVTISAPDANNQRTASATLSGPSCYMRLVVSSP